MTCRFAANLRSNLVATRPDCRLGFDETEPVDRAAKVTDTMVDRAAERSLQWTSFR
jgi:hypothetical protein